MGRDVIVACDFSQKKQLLAFLERFGTERPFLKVGMELFYAEGPQIIGYLKERGHQVFLDLKLHDIPNTVLRAMTVLSGCGADMVNLHAAGGKAMMEAAAEGARAGNGKTLVIAVTMLTSIDESVMKNELLIGASAREAVLTYAANAKSAGLSGVVCSPLEAAAVHGALGEKFLAVTPGVRLEEDEKGDQLRIATPQRAKALGADYIVVGRPITRAENPESAYQKFKDAFL